MEFLSVALGGSLQVGDVIHCNKYDLRFEPPHAQWYTRAFVDKPTEN